MPLSTQCYCRWGFDYTELFVGHGFEPFYSKEGFPYLYQFWIVGSKAEVLDLGLRTVLNKKIFNIDIEGYNLN
jgi:hypothetical protein